MGDERYTIMSIEYFVEEEGRIHFGNETNDRYINRRMSTYVLFHCGKLRFIELKFCWNSES